MSDKHYVALDLTGFENNGQSKPVSRVTLLVDDENSITAGDDTGLELVASCPFATQEMVNTILAQVKGHQCQPFSADETGLDPAAELGDGVTVGGVYSTLSRIFDDGNGYPNIASSLETELDEEYPTDGYMLQSFNRATTEIRSAIEKNAESIRLYVESADTRFSGIDLELDAITLTVAGLDRDMTAIEQRADSITLTVSSENGSTVFMLTDNKGELTTQSLDLTVDAVNVSGKLTASQIDATELHVDAANIDGQLTIGKLPDDVALIENIPAYTSELYNDSGFLNEKGVVTVIDGTVTADYVNALGVSAEYLQGRYVYLLDRYGESGGTIAITPATSSDYAVELSSDSGMRIEALDGNLYLEAGDTHLLLDGYDAYISCDVFAPAGSAAYLGYTDVGMWEALYAYTGTIQTSDRNLKNSIEELPKKYTDMIVSLAACRYKMNNGTSDRFHVGFVAQDVEEVMALYDIDSQEFGGLVKDVDEEGNEIYMLRYEEFIGILWQKVRELDKEIRALKGS